MIQHETEKMEACADNTLEVASGSCNTLLLVEKDGNTQVTKVLKGGSTETR